MAGGVGSTPRVAKTTIEEWTKMVSELTTKHLIVLALLKKKGLIKYGASGAQFRWPVRVKDHTLKPFPDAVPVTFERVNTKVNAFLGYRGYYLSDSITLREKLEQGGEEAMIKIFADRSSVLRDAAMRGMADKIFIDGDASGNENEFQGLESFMGIGTQVSTSALASVFNDTYAGLSTAVGGISLATNDRAWTPEIVNTDHTPAGGQQTWANYADEYLRKIFLRLKYGQAPSDRPDITLLTQESYEQLLNLLSAKERIPVARGSSMALVQMGFGDHIELDGVAITWDQSVPTTDADNATVRGYVLNTDRMELKVMGPKGDKQLFTSRVTFNDTYRADNIFMHCLGNFKFESPRYFGKLADISAVAS